MRLSTLLWLVWNGCSFLAANAGNDAANKENGTLCNLYMAMVPAPPHILSDEEASEDFDNSVVDMVQGRWALVAGRIYKYGKFIDMPADISLPLPKFGLAYLDRVEELGEGNVEHDLAHASVSVLYEYMWGGQHDGSAEEVMQSDEPALTAIPGIGVLASLESRHHCQVNYLLRKNAKFDVPSVHGRHMDPQSLTMTKSQPQFGAFTTYFNLSLVVTSDEDIHAGEEIVLPGMYEMEDGDDDEEGKYNEEDDEILEEVHYEMLRGFVDQIQEFFFQKHVDDVDEEAKHQMYHFLVNKYLEAGLGKPRFHYVAEQLFPPDLESFQDMLSDTLNDDGTVQNKDKRSPLFYGEPPSIEWLDENAHCVDQKSTIYPALSTIPEAGHGAFASRSFDKNERIFVVPLLPIPNSEILDVVMDETTNTLQKQILFNYCYGHAESDALFLPLAPGVNFINHHSEKQNVKLQWSTDPRLNFNQETLEQMDPYEILLDLFRPRPGPGDDRPMNIGFPAVGGLIMEIVATRDIARDEELWLSYGEDWEEAWNAHVMEKAQEHPNNVDEDALRAVYMNHRHLTTPLPTTAEQDEESFPGDHVQLKALVVFQDHGALHFLDDAHNVATILARRDSSKDSTSWVYDIQVENPEFDPTDDELDEPVPEFLEANDVPHDKFFFVDMPGTSDLFAANAYRHSIGIPDEIYPQNWRNLR